MTDIAAIIITVLITAIVSWALTHFIAKARHAGEMSEKDALLARKEAELEACETLRSQESRMHREAIETLKESQSQMLDATKKELALESERHLKEREESLKKQAEETLRNITGGLDKDIRDMKEAFSAQQKSHTEESSSIKTKFDETVTNLRLQAEAISSQAGDLTRALRGQNKMQGNFGETILENILKAEGLQVGRDYETEVYLRDKRGNIVSNDETGRRMRPDFVLHYPDSTDILLDSKVSLSALADYFGTDDAQARAEASKRNLQSVLKHIDELTGKEYQKYVIGRKTLDYVIMFIPNYGAWQLAKQEDPEIFSKAFSQNVLITTEETLIPFLRLIRTAWVQKERMEKMEEIVATASKIVDRVAAFSKAQTEVERSMESTLSKLKENGKRLVDGQQSIVGAARKLMDCGVPISPNKELPSSVNGD